MNDKLLVETAVLAGEIMLISGAEIFRVENTIDHILRKAGRETSEAIVFSTGIFASLNDPSIEAITVARRVTGRSTNLNRVYLVNDVSRKLCEDRITVEEAYRKLKEIRTTMQYSRWLKDAGIVGVSVFFTLLLGGGGRDFLAAAITGAVLAVAMEVSSRLKLNDFCMNGISAFLIAFTALSVEKLLLPGIRSDIIIIGAIMPLVPGVIFTTAIRDTLNGDYASGTARMMEAVVIALSVAAGVGAGIRLFQFMGGQLW
ncbi:threonine/serine exporter family protein [Lacrimispora xylanolytica]|uniref:Threonine/serine exporter family protein n=1 Tax=Lacrimispora xylanolytica TaxID=29375 RepID=A0ABY7AG18_9FIRM|nr:threonine/serine exporter family protein [Lacrimispora xylanolytica]WAJ24779.1 threonine/serine exporter family protein [Lacrimispora xylanolytica]